MSIKNSSDNGEELAVKGENPARRDSSVDGTQTTMVWFLPTLFAHGHDRKISGELHPVSADAVDLSGDRYMQIIRAKKTLETLIQSGIGIVLDPKRFLEGVNNDANKELGLFTKKPSIAGKQTKCREKLTSLAGSIRQSFDTFCDDATYADNRVLTKEQLSGEKVCIEECVKAVEALTKQFGCVVLDTNTYAKLITVLILLVFKVKPLGGDTKVSFTELRIQAAILLMDFTGNRVLPIGRDEQHWDSVLADISDKLQWKVSSLSQGDWLAYLQSTYDRTDLDYLKDKEGELVKRIWKFIKEDVHECVNSEVHTRIPDLSVELKFIPRRTIKQLSQNVIMRVRSCVEEHYNGYARATVNHLHLIARTSFLAGMAWDSIVLDPGEELEKLHVLRRRLQAIRNGAIASEEFFKEFDSLVSILHELRIRKFPVGFATHFGAIIAGLQSSGKSSILNNNDAHVPISNVGDSLTTMGNSRKVVGMMSGEREQIAVNGQPTDRMFITTAIERATSAPRPISAATAATAGHAEYSAPVHYGDVSIVEVYGRITHWMDILDTPGLKGKEDHPHRAAYDEHLRRTIDMNPYNVVVWVVKLNGWKGDDGEDALHSCETFYDELKRLFVRMFGTGKPMFTLTNYVIATFASTAIDTVASNYTALEGHFTPLMHLIDGLETYLQADTRCGRNTRVVFTERDMNFKQMNEALVRNQESVFQKYQEKVLDFSAGVFCEAKFGRAAVNRLLSDASLLGKHQSLERYIQIVEERYSSSGKLSKAEAQGILDVSEEVANCFGALNTNGGRGYTAYRNLVTTALKLNIEDEISQIEDESVQLVFGKGANMLVTNVHNATLQPDGTTHDDYLFPMKRYNTSHKESLRLAKLQNLDTKVIAYAVEEIMKKLKISHLSQEAAVKYIRESVPRKEKVISFSAIEKELVEYYFNLLTDGLYMKASITLVKTMKVKYTIGKFMEFVRERMTSQYSQHNIPDSVYGVLHEVLCTFVDKGCEALHDHLVSAQTTFFEGERV